MMIALCLKTNNEKVVFKIEYKIISTGSKGNAILLDNGILLDCGVPFKNINPYLKDIKLVFLSHEHSDHINPSTIKHIHDLRPTIRFCGGLFLKDKLIELGIKRSKIDVLKHNNTYNYGKFTIQPFILFHDVRNYGIKIKDKVRNKKILYAVDTNRIDHVIAKNYSLYLIEGNYDEEKIEQNIKEDRENGVFCYCERVKETHLSIQKASEFLMQNMGIDSKYELIHTSERNA